MSDNEKPKKLREEQVKIKADVKDAMMSLRDLERQVRKLKDLADSGESDQRGYLSKRQVGLYRRLSREIEDTYKEHYSKLQRMEKDHHKKLDTLDKEVQRRQKLLNHAEGGNKWGDVASDNVRDFHRKKLDEAHNSLKQVTLQIPDLEELRTQVTKLEDAVSKANVQQNRIGELRQYNASSQRMADSIIGTAGTLGLFTGMGAYLSYINPDLLRKQERSANDVSLRMQEYDNTKDFDSVHRESVQPVGERNNYGLMDTLNLQGVLARGGLSTVDNINDDTNALQKYSRAYSQDPSMLAQDFNILRKMGAMDDGEANRLANLIGGSVAKNSMNGREEEQQRALMNLISQTSRGLATFSESQVNNVASLQTTLGQSVPELKGERGASLLSGMDEAIKGGDHQFDLIMGKGTKFTGLQGMYKLDFMKEEGLSNPETAKLFFEGLNEKFGDNEQMKAYAFKETGMGTLHQYESLRDSGFISKILQGKQVDPKKLREAGFKDLAKQYEKYQDSETSRVDFMESQGENLRGDHQKARDELGKTIRGNLWHGMTPDSIQHILTGMAGIGAGAASWGLFGRRGLRRRLGRGIDKLTNPKINGKGASLGGKLSTFGKAGGKALGFLSAVDMGDTASINFWDWVFGHDKGDEINESLFSNPFNKPKKYLDDRKPIWQRNGWWGDEDKASHAPEKSLSAMGGNKDMSAMALRESAGISISEAQRLIDDVERKRQTMVTTLDKATDKQHTIKVVIEGKIEGMDDSNQKEIKESIKDHFRNVVGSYRGAVNLAYDQHRLI